MSDARKAAAWARLPVEQRAEDVRPATGKWGIKGGTRIVGDTGITVDEMRARVPKAVAEAGRENERRRVERAEDAARRAERAAADDGTYWTAKMQQATAAEAKAKGRLAISERYDRAVRRTDSPSWIATVADILVITCDRTIR